ncbi:MAG: hypothetical protein GY936_18275 [Ignavibacteriae bacterium]|nr:hypothetical protein [Ignavibacteriota bacterium]
MRKKILSSIASFAFLLALTLQIGCNSETMKEQGVKSVISETLQKETQIDSFSIIVSSAGGFTGLGSGYTLTSNGKVKHWKQLSFVKDTTLWERESDLSKIVDFKNQLDTCGILQKDYRGTGNMTTSLNYNLQDTSYTWTWEGKGNSSNIPEEINDWFKDLLVFCAKK